MSALPVDIYTRVSRQAGRADERFHSVDEQVALARRFAESRGLEIGIELTPDVDRSGGTVEREGLQQALERIRAGQSSGFVVAWIDRFSRDAAQAHALLTEIEAAGGRVWAPEMPDEAPGMRTPEGELQLGIFLLFAAYIRNRARAGFQRAKARAIMAGVPVGPVPVGYRQVGHPTKPRREWGDPERQLEPDPDTAPIVREIFERRAKGATSSASLTALADFLGDKTGRVWSKQAIAAILANEIYTGVLRYGDGPSAIVNPHGAPAIVDAPLWQAAQRVRVARAPRNPNGAWLLTGLAVCGECGRKLAPWTGSKLRKDGTKPRRYRCNHRPCERHRRSIDADRLETHVVETVFALLGAEVEKRGTEPDTEPLARALEDAERRLDQVMADGAADDLGELWAPEVRRRRLAVDEAAAALGAARAGAGSETEIVKLRERWPAMKPTERREALALYLLAYVEVTSAEPGAAVIGFK